eukprot:96137_1
MKHTISLLLCLMNIICVIQGFDLRSFGIKTKHNNDPSLNLIMRVYDDKEGKTHQCIFYRPIRNDSEYHCEKSDMEIVSHCCFDNPNYHRYVELEVATNINIAMYSKGEEQPSINGTNATFIKVDGTTIAGKRGMNIVVLDKINGNFIESVVFDLWGNGKHKDEHMVEYLNSIDPDNIVLIAVHDSAEENEKSLKMLNDWGCKDVQTVGYREAFIFIGTASNTNIPSWTYCQKSARGDDPIEFKIDLEVETSPINNGVSIDSVYINHHVFVDNFCWNSSLYFSHFPQYSLYHQKEEILTKDLLIGNVTVEPRMTVQFEIKINSKCVSETTWCQILVVGSTELESQVPAIYVKATDQTVHIQFSDENSWNSGFQVGGGFVLPSNDDVWHTVYVELTPRSRRFIWDDDKIYHDESGTFNALFINQTKDVYITEPSSIALNALIRKIRINSPSFHPVQCSSEDNIGYDSLRIGSADRSPFLIRLHKGGKLNEGIIQSTDIGVYNYLSSCIKNIGLNFDYSFGPPNDHVSMELCWNGLQY